MVLIFFFKFYYIHGVAYIEKITDILASYNDTYMYVDFVSRCINIQI